MTPSSPPHVAPLPTKTSKRTHTLRRTPSSDLQVVTGGGVLSHTPAECGGVVRPREQRNGNPTVAPDNVPHTPSRAEPDSEHNPSSQAPPMVSDNSRFTRNEETGYNAKESIEKKSTVEQRRNETLDERNGGRPDPHRARHPQPKPVSLWDRILDTVASVQPSANRREQHLPDVLLTESPLAGHTVSSGYHAPLVSIGQPPAPLPSASESLSPPNGDHEVSSSSDSASSASTSGRRGTHTNLRPVRSGHHPPPLSHSQPTVSIQPSPKSPPDTTIQHKPSPPNAESAHAHKRRGWSCIVRCDCINVDCTRAWSHSSVRKA